MAKLFMGLVLIATTAAALGQSTYNTSGKGDFTQGGDKRRVSDVSVSFARETFSLSIGLASGRRVVVDGTTNGGGRKRKVRVVSLDGLRIDDGSGTIELEDDAIRSIDIFGGTGADRYSVKFKADDRSTDGPPSLGNGGPSGDSKGRARFAADATRTTSRGSSSASTTTAASRSRSRSRAWRTWCSSVDGAGAAIPGA